MATFPALRPASRVFTAAIYPNATHVAYSGRENRVRTSNAMTGARLRLQFLAITETQMLQVASHYAGQRGRFLPFPLSTEVLSGMADPSILSPAGYQWIYVGVPKVTDISVGTAAAPSCVHDVELELEMVPEISAFTGGASWVASAVLAGGAADSGEINLTGAAWSAAAAITGGAGTAGSSVAGADWTAAAAIAGGGYTDANFSSVSLLLHMDGSNGSTTFADSSSAARTVTASGNAQISTVQSKFGGASALFDGTTDYLTAPSSSDFALFSGDFTIEFWVYVASSTTPNQCCIQLSSSGTERANISIVSNLIVLYTETGGNNGSRITGTAPSTETWNHVALVRSGSTTTLFLEGVSLGTASSAPYPSGDMLVEIGANSRAAGATCLNGYIDELRITNGIARYTGSSYTVPTAAFPNS